jgi:hypothetical protein
MKRFIMFCAAVLLVLASVSATSAAAPEDVFAFDAKEMTWVLKKGGEAEGTPNGGLVDAGMWFYAVKPEQDEAAKGLKPGILLYNAKAKKYSFLPVEGEEVNYVDGVDFSPNVETMVVSMRMSRFGSQLTVYDVKTLEEKRKFMGYSGVFFIDDVRFAFTLFDEKIERPEAAGLWGTSAAMYDPAADGGAVTLKQATKKESFTVMGLADDMEHLNISVTSVKSEKDWEDTDKWEDSETTVEVPAAG